MGEKKDENIQMVRGLCIAAVVLIHSGNAVGMQSMSGQEWQFWYWLILRQLVNFAVGVFFFLSGLLVDQEKVRRTPTKFILNRMNRLLIPFVVWSCVYTFKMFLSEWPEVDGMSLLLHFIAGKTAAPFYFILVLMQLNIITPFLLRMKGNRPAEFVIWCITPIYLVALGTYCVLKGNQPVLYETVFPAWLIYYWAGIVWKSNRKAFPIKTKYILAALVFSIVNAVTLVILLKAFALAPSQVRLATVPYALMLAVWFITHRFPLPGKVIWKCLGDNSYGIFYIHCMMLLITNGLLLAAGGGQNIFIVQAINWFGSIRLSLVACKILQKMLGRKRAMKWLGV